MNADVCSPEAARLSQTRFGSPTRLSARSSARRDLVGSDEARVPLLEPVSVGTPRGPLWDDDRFSMEALKELEHWTVFLFEETLRDTHFVVGCDPDEIVIERPVVD